MIELAGLIGVDERADKPSIPMLSLAAQVAYRSSSGADSSTLGSVRMLRRHWFGAMQGGSEFVDERRDLLRNAGFDPVLFHKAKGGREKGVDLAIAREMLIQGFNRNYRVALLIAGDADYVGLVSDLKRMGLLVYGAFYDSKAMSSELRRTFDCWYNLPHPLAINKGLMDELRAKHGC
jgi:uncharacterized LabA/DUF88 family protein